VRKWRRLCLTLKQRSNSRIRRTNKTSSTRLTDLEIRFDGDEDPLRQNQGALRNWRNTKQHQKSRLNRCATTRSIGLQRCRKLNHWGEAPLESRQTRFEQDREKWARRAVRKVGENNGAVSKKTWHVEPTWKGQAKRWQNMGQESDACGAIKGVDEVGG
jgi:hypothetical protein